MKIKFRDKVIAVILLTVLVIGAVFNYIVFPAYKKVDKLKNEKEKVESLLSDIKPLMEEVEEKKVKKEEVYKKYEHIKLEEANQTATVEEFLVYLGNSAEKHKAKVTGFSDLGNSFEEGIYRSYYDIELSGTPYAITHVVEDIDKMDIVCSVGSVSLRQDKEYDYLKRFFDSETNLKWYKEPDEESEKKDKDNKDKETAESNDPVRIVIPESGNIEDTLSEFLNISSLNDIFKLMSNTSSKEATKSPHSNEMRLSFTVCLVMFNEPSPETSFLNIEDGGSQ